MNPTPVFILNWNASDMTERCLSHLAEQTLSGLSWVVMDNGSHVHEVERMKAMESRYPEAHFIYSEDNLGYTKAHLHMYRWWMEHHPDTEYILLINNDAFATPNWAECMIKCADVHQSDMVSGVMLQADHPELIDNVGHIMLNTGEILPILSGERWEDHKASLPDTNHGPCAGAALYRVTMLERIGFFDPHFITGYEDAELGVRGWSAGCKATITPDAIVYHVGSHSIQRLPRQAHVDRVQQDIYYTVLKLMPWPVLVYMMPWRWMKYSAAILINIIFGRWGLVTSLIRAWYHTWITAPRYWRVSRRAFHREHQSHLITNWRMISGMRFFLMTDVRRFFKLISGR